MGIISLWVATPPLFFLYPSYVKPPFLKHFQPSSKHQAPLQQIFFTYPSLHHIFLLAFSCSYLTFLFNSSVAIKATDNFCFPF